MFPLSYILKNKQCNVNEKFRSCINHNSILPSDINLDIVKFAKHSLNILVEAKVKGLSAKGTFMNFSGVPGTQRFS